MKIKSFILGLLALLTTIFSVNGQAFQWKRVLQPHGSSGWHSFSIPPEVAGKTQPGYQDMRILVIGKAGDTTEAPYVINSSVILKKTTENHLEILNKSTRESRFYYTLKQKEPLETLNEMDLSFSEKNFDLKVTLEGSIDQQQWFTVLKDYRITSISNNKANFQFTTLSFNFSNYKYYRLSIPAEKDPVLQDAQSGITMEQNEGVWWEFKGIGQKTESLKKEKKTICMAELAEPMPVSMIQLHLKDSFDYMRPISVLAVPWPNNNTGAIEDQYVSVGSGTLNSFDRQHIPIAEVLTKRVKIIIHDNDNIPLHIDSVTLKVAKKLVITRLPEAENYLLVYGNKSLPAPNYDLAEVLDKMSVPDLLEVTIGPEQRNLPEKPKSWWENNTWIYVLIGLIILMLGGFTLKMMKKGEAGNEEVGNKQ